MGVSVRSSPVVEYEYSWLDTTEEKKCIISVMGNISYTDSSQTVSASIRASDYSVGVISGATENNDGKNGLAPKPFKGQSSYVLTGNGQWTPNLLQIRKNENVAAGSSLAITIDDTNFYLLSITADSLPQQDLYIISSCQGGGKLDATRLTGSGDNSLYPISRTDDTVLTVTNNLQGSSLRCKLYKINLPTIW